MRNKNLLPSNTIYDLSYKVVHCSSITIFFHLKESSYLFYYCRRAKAYFEYWLQ